MFDHLSITTIISTYLKVFKIIIDFMVGSRYPYQQYTINKLTSLLKNQHLIIKLILLNKVYTDHIIIRK